MNYNILITGGCGFIGSHICRYLLQNGCKFVRVVDNLSTGKLSNIQDLLDKYDNIEFIWGDIENIELCRKVCTNIDIISHQAAIGSVPKSIEEPMLTHNTNVNGSFNLLYVAVEKNIKKFIYASSSAIYGDTTKNLLSPYAATKYINEIYANIFHKCYNIQCIGLRYFNVFGPNQNLVGSYASVIPLFINNLNKGIPCIIYGDGTNSRDFTYIDNVVHANINAIIFNINSGTYDIGTGKTININKLYELIATYMHCNIKPIYEMERPGDIKHSSSNIIQAKMGLNYNVITSFEEGLYKTINYIVNKK